MEVQPSAALAHIPPLPAEHPVPGVAEFTQMLSMQLRDIHILSSITLLRLRTAATDKTLSLLASSPPQEESQPQESNRSHCNHLWPLGSGDPSSVALASTFEPLGEVVVLNVDAVDADGSVVGAEEIAVSNDEMSDTIDAAVVDTKEVVVKLGEAVEVTSSLVEDSIIVVVEVDVEDEVSALDIAGGKDS
ncbi:hypothetical protein SMACR_08685 [Sordaria macrospora]|uniref:WGS project CABT00000000 data, contig 2.63 n=2 Tax=Sordaria macrospora TaxID=5147 RepID=F7WAN2_SORMK|nr:uncharacterized protein SMAC_08685 [Sordaria macrospora k-hell]KAA8629571.1 hypothetical protein SMACR_08685 [Sordaria macrospora]KAH7635353.1 hypothetical protein B0T09DRAFT_379156 [Sordaria sp. MPI-SDFR-AT-0083]WPJ67292.1 hypothetical protein SMAC4_08685 [Sordaria macrospora]CCC14227.1 unnamed protein product [Sordaria macrospora k-hell]